MLKNALILCALAVFTTFNLIANDDILESTVDKVPKEVFAADAPNDEVLQKEDESPLGKTKEENEESTPVVGCPCGKGKHNHNDDRLITIAAESDADESAIIPLKNPEDSIACEPCDESDESLLIVLVKDVVNA